jgi:proteic killer suppression protein
MKVSLRAQAQKGLQKAPKHIQEKFFVWVDMVERLGIEKVRRIPGFHDEPLKGKRAGQRSIRLNKQWRAIYVWLDDKIHLIEILEVTPHDY